MGFHSISKSDGLRRRHITQTMLKQIAGRAGRYRAAGVVTTLRDDELQVRG